MGWRGNPKGKLGHRPPTIFGRLFENAHVSRSQPGRGGDGPAFALSPPLERRTGDTSATTMQPDPLTPLTPHPSRFSSHRFPRKPRGSWRQRRQRCQRDSRVTTDSQKWLVRIVRNRSARVPGERRNQLRVVARLEDHGLPHGHAPGWTTAPRGDPSRRPRSVRDRRFLPRYPSRRTRAAGGTGACAGAST